MAASLKSGWPISWLAWRRMFWRPTSRWVRQRRCSLCSGPAFSPQNRHIPISVVSFLGIKAPVDCSPWGGDYARLVLQPWLSAFFPPEASLRLTCGIGGGQGFDRRIWAFRAHGDCGPGKPHKLFRTSRSFGNRSYHLVVWNGAEPAQGATYCHYRVAEASDCLPDVRTSPEHLPKPLRAECYALRSGHPVPLAGWHPAPPL